MGCSERQKEIKRRRHRKQKIAKYKKRLGDANATEKAVIAEKLRQLTPGGEHLARDWELK